MLDLTNLRDAVRHEGRVSRRLFLAYAAALASLPLVAERAALAQGVPARAGFPKDPFALGIASGDPEPTGVVLWTRLAPEPLQPDGGMRPEPVDVAWEVAEDDAFRKVAASGKAVAAPQMGHAVHVEVQGLRPDRWYWYRFRAGDAASPVGRTRTAPDATATPAELRFAFASCQHYEAGLFTAYQQMAKDELDLVVHLGDYIYEGAGTAEKVRKHAGPQCRTLAEYRVRHGQYRSDPLLQAAHARCPWVVTWDDHEVSNNYAGLEPGHRKTAKGTEAFDTAAAHLARRAAAYQAYYEAMPLRKASLPHGPDMQLYRTSSFGRLAAFQVLDTRQFRTNIANDDKQSDLPGEASDPKRTILGAAQRDWLRKGLAESPATWNVLAQQVMMGMVDHVAGPGHGYSMDQWPGYAHDRIELVKFMAERKVSNPVVLTGDIHSNWVNDLRVDDRQADKPVVATEFVGTSISSGGKGTAKPASLAKLMAENPGVKFHDAMRGYVRCKVTPGAWQSDYVQVDDVTKPGGKISTSASFVVEAGRPGAKRA
ncbi:MAG TPA: alkaline phosphatase D family protein [Humisphaera sp.]